MIVTIVVLEPSTSVHTFIAMLGLTAVIVEPSYEGPKAEWHACYFPDLWRCLGFSYHAFGLHIEIDNGQGYPTSLPFLEWPGVASDLPEDSPARVRFPATVRLDVSLVLDQALDASLIGQALFFFESTVYSTEVDLEYKYDGTPVYGPLALDQFWSDHDNGCLWAEAIYQLVKPAPHP